MKVRRYLPDRNRPLLAWQRPALARMLSQENPGLFFDMRLGKSIMSIEYCIRRGLKRVLVLSPKTAIVSWTNELRLEDSENFFILDTPKRKNGATTATAPGWYLASLQTPLTVPFFLAQWDAIVIDESSRIKNPKANITKTLLKYYAHIPHKIILSGTPNPETITNLVTQLIFKDGEVFGCRTYWDFRHKYMRLVGYDWILKPGVYDELKRYVQRTCIQLSQKGAGWDTTVVREKIRFTLNYAQIDHIKELSKRFETTIKGKLYTTKHVLPQTQMMAKIACGYIDGNMINDAKTEWLRKFLSNNAYGGAQYSVWFHFNDDLYYMENLLKLKTKLKVEIMCGKIKLKDRMDIQHRFQDRKIDVLLMQTKLAQYALDLSQTTKSIYYSNSFSCEERIQSENRIRHTNRISPPEYMDLVFEDSPEVDILEALKEKKFSFSNVWASILKRGRV